MLTAVATTVISFLPVFAMEAAEGKLFKPLAFTKTFALISSVIVALTLIPPLAHILFAGKIRREKLRIIFFGSLILLGVIAAIIIKWYLGVIIALIGAYYLAESRIPQNIRNIVPFLTSAAAILFVTAVLSEHWVPMGPEQGVIRNFVFVALMIGILNLLSFLRKQESMNLLTAYPIYIYADLLRSYDHHSYHIGINTLLRFILPYEIVA